MAKFYRSDQARIDVRVSGITIDTESWDVLEGGDRTAEDLTIFPGGMKPQVPLGGIAKRAPVKVQRAWSSVLIPAFKALDEAAGSTEAEATYTVLEANGSKAEIAGNPITYKGVLLKVERPNYKAGTSEVPFLTVDLGLNGTIG